MRAMTVPVLLLIAILTAALLVAPSYPIAQAGERSDRPDIAVVILTPEQGPGTTSPIISGQEPRGAAIVQLNSGRVCYWLWVSGMSNVSTAQISLGAPGAGGQAVAWLFPSDGADRNGTVADAARMPGSFTGLLAGGNITAADLVGPMEGGSLDDLIEAGRDGLLHVTVRTAQGSGGEIRGQISGTNIWTSSLAFFMSPLEQTRFNTTDPRWNISGMAPGSGPGPLGSLKGVNLGAVPWGLAVLRPNGPEVHYALFVFNIANVTRADLHLGEVGEEGPAVAWLYPSSNATVPLVVPWDRAGTSFNGKLIEDNISAAELTGPLDGRPIDDLLAAMVDGSVYVGVYTTQNTGGEIRGQIDPTNMSCPQGRSRAA